MLADTRLLIVSNRLPVTIERTEQGYQVEPSSGGLVTALRPIVRAQNGCWVGWTGSDYDREIEALLRSRDVPGGCRLLPVFLTEGERTKFYRGFSNEILWPLFHDLQSRCNFEPSYWRSYVEANEKFAAVVGSASTGRDVIWVHDYHLMLQAELLRNAGATSQLAYFHHIPFPAPDIFEKLPWRLQILAGLLRFDLIGFQTARDQRNFLNCVQRFLPNTRTRQIDDHVLVSGEKSCAVIGSFPIGIDFLEFAGEAAREDVQARANELRQALSKCQIVLGVDRLDYTKGIPERLKAFRALLEASPELRRRIALIQVVVPSREAIPKYRELKLEVERLVSEINGSFGSPEWTPIHYIHRQLPRAELVACYLAADIALITPLKDGMNLVAKEFCAAQVENAGVLVLSEFAGAASQLACGALLVNPYDAGAVAQALRSAFYMPPRERQTRMMRLRHNVKHNDLERWFSSYWQASQSRKPGVGAAESEKFLLTSRLGGVS